MGNDHSSSYSASVSALQQQTTVKRRESIAMVRSPDEMPIQAQFEMRRRRISSCVIGIHPQKQQQQFQNHENNLGSDNSSTHSSPPHLPPVPFPSRPVSPRHSAFRSNRPLSQNQFARELPLTPTHHQRASGTHSSGLSPQSLNRHLLSPAGNRNRRMSVAGDHQEALRRELARAEIGASPNSNVGTGSGSQTPQRRFSRANANNGGSRKLSSIRIAGDDMFITGTETSVAEQLKLSSYQLQILQQSWPRIRSQGSLSCVFRELAQTNSAAKEMFQKMSIVEGFSSGKVCDQKEHVRQLVELIDFALQHLNSPTRIIQQKCHSMGEQHFSVFGQANESKIWDDFGECISHAIAKAEPVRGKREAFRAWINLITFMVESMRAGYVQQFKRRSLTRHSSNSQLAIVQLATVEEINSPPASIGGQINREKQRSITPSFPPLSALQL